MIQVRYDFTIKEARTQKVRNTGYMEIKNQTSNQTELHIYGDIVSTCWDKWSSEDTCPQDIVDFLSQIADDKDLTIYINSGGGDVFAGIGIYNIIRRHKGYTVGIVEGIAASIASVILMACDERRVLTGAQVMIHKPLTMSWGNADDFLKIIERLDHCQKSITDIYMERAKEGITEETITHLINAETWMNGEDAAQYFDLTIDQQPAIAACVSWMLDCYKNIPQQMEVKERIFEEEREKEDFSSILEDLHLFGT